MTYGRAMVTLGGILGVGAMLFLLSSIKPKPINNCFDPLPGRRGVSYGASGLLDIDSGLPDDVHCDVFVTDEGHKAFFNASLVDHGGCVYGEVLGWTELIDYDTDTAIGGINPRVLEQAGDPNAPAAIQCFKWAEEALPESPFAKHWSKMRKY